MQPIYLYRQNESDGAVRVDRFPATPRAVMTIAQHTAGFVGTVLVEGSIVSEPTDNDWFEIFTEEYVDFFPLEEMSRNRIRNVAGRFIWMKVTVTPQEGRYVGSVDRVMVI
jgi:hypothetical protein